MPRVLQNGSLTIQIDLSITYERLYLILYRIAIGIFLPNIYNGNFGHDIIIAFKIFWRF